MVIIRLARHGRIHRPHYHIVVVDSRSPRDGKFLEKLGRYYPHTDKNLYEINLEGILKWLKKGAHISDTVKSLLKKHKITLV